MPVNITLNLRKPLPGSQNLPMGNYNEQRYGFCGMVTEVHPEDNTVHVRMDTQRELTGLRVASLEWVTIDDKKGFLSGQRRLPPVDTFVFCLMPTGEESSAFVLCSLFGYNVADHAAFKENTEDAKHIKKNVTNSGWVTTEDNRTGTKIIKNKEKDETIKIEINQEDSDNEKIKLTIHKNVYEIEKNYLKAIIDKCCLTTDGKKWELDANGNKIIHDDSKTVISGSLEVSK